MNTGEPNMKTGIITLKLADGWIPWAIGTFRDALRLKADTGATAFAFCPVTPMPGGRR